MSPVTPLRRGNLGWGFSGGPQQEHPPVTWQWKIHPIFDRKNFQMVGFSMVIHVSFRGVNHEAMKNIVIRTVDVQICILRPLQGRILDKMRRQHAG